MRKLNSQEKEWIGGFALLVLIIGVPFVSFMNWFNPLINNWGEKILLQLENKNMNYVNIAIMWVIIYYFYPLIIIPLLMGVGVHRILLKLGWMSDLPENWKPYLLFNCKECHQIFRTRNEFKTHKAKHLN